MEVKVQRLGLRYVDFITPTAGKAPEDYFNDGFGCMIHAFGEIPDCLREPRVPSGTDGAMRVQFGRGILLTWNK